LIIIDQK